MHVHCKMLGRALLVALAFVATATALADGERVAPETVGFSAERLVRLDGYLKAKVAGGHLPGAVVHVARHGKTVFLNTYGQADSDAKQALKEDDLFRVYSMTKPIVGVAMMILFEEGKWRLDDPITKFLPELAQLKVLKDVKSGLADTEPATRVPTMRELVTHTGGFAYGLSTVTSVDKALYEADFMRARNADDAVARIARVPLLFQPGTHWNYSASVDLQGYIIERISKQSLGEFMESRVFAPLGMRDTAFFVPQAKRNRLVRLEQFDATSRKLVDAKGILVLDYSKQPGAPSGGAGLVSTLRDYSRFAQMLANKGALDGAHILAPSSVRLLRSNLIADPVHDSLTERFTTQNGMGFGVDVSVVLDPAKAATTQGTGTFAWGGAAGTWFWVDPTNDLICVGMIQVMDRWSDPELANIDNEVSALVYGALVKPET
jgi:CubicO group peptidase (beta-lactamase class C family)